MAMRDVLYLEDLKPGQRFKTGFHPLTEDEIMMFARDYDPQPFHTDPEAARHGFFGGLAASGWHTAAISMRLQVESGPPLAGGMIGASVELTWPRPTRPGDILHVESEILEVVPSSSRPDRGMIVLKSQTKNQKDEVLQLQTSRLLVWRRKAP
jgi:acyl dehydratase